MIITTVTIRELNQDVGRAKKAAKSGPVFHHRPWQARARAVQPRGLRRLAGQGRSLVDALSMPGLPDLS